MNPADIFQMNMSVKKAQEIIDAIPYDNKLKGLGGNSAMFRIAGATIEEVEAKLILTWNDFLENLDSSILRSHFLQEKTKIYPEHQTESQSD